MLNRSIRRTLLASTVIAGAAIAAPLHAQAVPAESAPQAADAQAEDIVVTGTLIQNPNLEQSSPVAVVTDEEFELQQTNTAEEILRELPGVAANVGSGVNNGQGGSSYVDLRGLGINRNVVLLDGMRIVPARGDGASDLNNIPLALIERLDVLTGGASTVYGADAVSGVVNFVTRRDFAGVELDLSEQITEQADGNIFRADLTLGANFDDGRGNAVLSVGYQEADPVYQGQRSFSVDNLDSADGSPGGSGTTVPTRFSLTGFPKSVIDPTTGALDTSGNFAPFNFNPQNILQTPFERFNIYGAGHYEVTDDIEVYAQGMFSRNKVASIIASSGIFGTTVEIPVSNPFLPLAARNQFCAAMDFNPTLDGVQTLTPAECAAAANATGPTDPAYRSFFSNVNRRFVEAGTRDTIYTTTFWQQKAGVRGDITDNLAFDVFATYGRSELLRENIGYGLLSRVEQALLASDPNSCHNTANNCVPLNLFGPQGSITPEMIAFIDAAAASDRQDNSLTQVRGVLNGELGAISTEADPIGFAVGAEYRRNTARRKADSLSQQPGEVLGLGGAPAETDNATNVKEVFAELIAPLIADRPFFHSLTLEAGIRYSDYSTTGGALTYKLGGSWEPVPSLKIRGAYNRATRSPNITELYATEVTGLNNSAFDPCQGAAPTTNATLRAICIAQGAPPSTIGSIDPPSAGQVNVTAGGNPDLDVEKADTFTIGFVFQPEFVPGLALTVDYYNITIKDAITAPTIDDQLRECFGGSTPETVNPAPGAENSPECAEFGRDPTTGGLDGDPSDTPGIALPLSNQGRIFTDGIDVALNYRRDMGFADLGLSANFNWTMNSEFIAKPGSFDRECVGFYSVNCGAPGNGTAVSGGVGSIQPEFSWNVRTTLGFESVDVSLLWRHISAVEAEPVVAGDFLEEFTEIEAFDWFDLSTRWEATENFTFVFTVQNLFDKKPPIVGSTIGSTSFNSGNTYPSTYDTLGRRFAIGANVKF